jgi:hypothetical membrane protein
VASLRWTGLAAVAVLWGTVAVGMRRSGLGFFDAEPISYLGTVARTVVLFRGGLVVAAVLLAAFTLFVRSALPVARGFLVASLVGYAGQVVAGIVPISGPGLDHPVHTVGGIVLGLSLPVLMWRFAAGQADGPWRARAYGLLWLEVAACVAGVLLSRSGRAPIAEMLPAVAFHLWIAVVTARAASGRVALSPSGTGGRASPPAG